MKFIPPIIVLSATLLTGQFVIAAEPGPAELKRAQDLYVAKCAKCHALPVPARYSEAQWKSWMDKMSKKSHLTPQQSQLLAKYSEQLQANPKRQ